MKLSVIIPCGGNYPERVRNLHEVFMCLGKQTYRDFELVLVEQTVDGSYYHSQLPCDKYIQIADPKGRGFNRSWCRNVGAYNAAGEIILLMDGDYVFPADYFQQVIKMKDVFFSGTDLYLWSTLHELEKYYQTKDIREFQRSPSKLRPFLKGIACGGIVGFNREWFLNEFVGYNENFFQYGFEDTEAVHRIQRILGKGPQELARVPVHVAHLYHRERDGKFGTNNQLYDRFIQWDIALYTQMLKGIGVGDTKEPKILPQHLTVTQ